MNQENLKELRRNGYSFREIPNKTSVPLKTVWMHTRYVKFSNKGLKRYQKMKMVTKQIKRQNSNLSVKKARIISHLFFDGSLFKIPKEYHSIIKYVNSSKKLIEQFRKDVKLVYGIEPSSLYFDGKIWRIAFSSKLLVKDLLNYSKSYSTSNVLAKIPNEIMHGTRIIKLELLKAFWDDEGFISSDGRLGGDLRSKQIMNQLAELHREFGFKFNVYTYCDYGKPMYKIYLFKTKKNVKRFIELQLFTNSIVTRGKFKGRKKIDVLKFLVKTIKYK